MKFDQIGYWLQIKPDVITVIPHTILIGSQPFDWRGYKVTELNADSELTDPVLAKTQGAMCAK